MDTLLRLAANLFRLEPNPDLEAGVAVTVGVNDVLVMVVAGSPVFFLG